MTAVLGQEIAERAWTKFIAGGDVRPSDDFFGQGGHSMLLLQMAAWIKSESGRDLVLADFLRDPTREGLGRCLEVKQDRTVHVQEFGSGPNVILCVPGSYGRAIAFSRIADELSRLLDGAVRLRCYELWNAVESMGSAAAIEAVATQMKYDFALPRVAGIAGYSLGGLFPFIRDFSAALPTCHLWLIDTYPAIKRRTHKDRLRSGLWNAVRHPALLPGASMATAQGRLRSLRKPTHSALQTDHPKRWQIQELLDGMLDHPWHGPATLIRLKHRVLWTPFYNPSDMNGLRDLLGDHARSAPVSSTHVELLTRGADQVAAEIAQDLQTAGICPG